MHILSYTNCCVKSSMCARVYLKTTQLKLINASLLLCNLLRVTAFDWTHFGTENYKSVDF